MKNLNSLFLALAFTILMITAVDTQAQKITGDGNVVQETRSVGSFEGIKLEGLVNLILLQGNTESLIVETDKNLLPYVMTVIDNNTLAIGNKKDVNIKKSTKMNVYVTIKDLRKIESNGVGSVKSQGKLNLNELKIYSSGVGNYVLDLNADKLEANINSVGNLTFTGKVSSVNIDNSGVGNVKAFDLSTDILKIESNGVGNSEVSSEKEIYINLNGMGNVSYKGNAVVKEMNVNGMGKVTKE